MLYQILAAIRDPSISSLGSFPFGGYDAQALSRIRHRAWTTLTL